MEVFFKKQDAKNSPSYTSRIRIRKMSQGRVGVSQAAAADAATVYTLRYVPCYATGDLSAVQKFGLLSRTHVCC